MLKKYFTLKFNFLVENFSISIGFSPHCKNKFPCTALFAG